MPCEYSIDRDRRLVLSRAQGILSYEELREHQNSLRVNPAFDASFNQIWDFTGVSATTVTAEQVRDLARPVFFSAESRRAIVITKANPVVYGLLRMWEIYVEIETGRIQTSIFPDVKAAMNWIESRWATA